MEEPTIAQLLSSIGSSTKGKKKILIHSYSYFEEDSSEFEFSELEFEEGHSSRVIHGRKMPLYIPNPYIQRPHTRTNKNLRLTRKIIANLALRDEIINIDESPENEPRNKKIQQKKKVQKRKSTKG